MRSKTYLIQDSIKSNKYFSLVLILQGVLQYYSVLHIRNSKGFTERALNPFVLNT